MQLRLAYETYLKNKNLNHPKLLNGVYIFQILVDTMCFFKK